LIFFVTAFCLTGSVAYVYFLQASLNRDLLHYFEIKDYLEITVLWLFSAYPLDRGAPPNHRIERAPQLGA
jgi:hypothetical protein